MVKDLAALVEQFRDTAMDLILRYQTTINRQFFQAMNQLERLQRLRKGDNVPAPLKVEVLGEPPTLSEQQDSLSERA